MNLLITNVYEPCLLITYHIQYFEEKNKTSVDDTNEVNVCLLFTVQISSFFQRKYLYEKF